MLKLSNLKNVLQAQPENDSGAVTTEYVAIMAMMGIGALFLSGMIFTQLSNLGADVAGCIEGSSLVQGNTQAGMKNCRNQNHAGQNGRSLGEDAFYSENFSSRTAPGTP